MKRLLIIFLSAAAISLTACDKFLERPVAGAAPEEIAIQNEADVQAVLNGGFNNLAVNVYGGRLQFINDLMSDQVNGVLYTGDDGEFYRRSTSIFGAFKNDFYRNLYYIINSANRGMANLDKASTNRAGLEGQARFLRGVVHFELVRMFAQPWGFTANNDHLGVPLRIASSPDPLSRATVKEVYDAIIADLQVAENNLPDVGTNNLPSKWAAKAFLAKVYFQQNNFQQAFNYADQVIKSNKFQLDATHSLRFSLNAGTTGTKEGIYVYKSVVNNLTPGGELRDRYRSDATNFQPGSDFHVTDLFFGQATASSDGRKEWYEKNAAGFNMLKKYNADFFDLPIVHLTEIRLIRAEAGAEVGGANLAVAIEDINAILVRAYGQAAALGTNATAALVINTARTQRELEMIGEGNRLQEIKRIGARNGSNIDRRGSRWNCPGMVLQFPSGEQAANTGFPFNPEGGCN